MKINYNTLLELNKQSVVDEHGQLGCFWVIQHGVEKFLHGDPLTDQHKQLLIDMGVLELTEEEENSKSIVGPFKFGENGD
jgi:hypothetical protein